MNSMLCALAAVGLALGAAGAADGQVVRSGSGLAAADIAGAVGQFRTDLGGNLNPNQAGSFGTGRREINWDGVPDTFAAPNALPGNFFNVNSPRGVTFSGPGTGLAVSANAASGTAINFGNINPAYTTVFTPFSAQRLFTAIGSNVVDVNFFVPGSTTATTTRGFGAVFSDVDLANTTSIQYFDAGGAPLGTFFAPGLAGAAGAFSFVGVSFPTAVVGRVRITSGNAALGVGVNDGPNTDLVVMDDFIYGEPVPGPGAGVLMALAGLSAGRRRR